MKIDTMWAFDQPPNGATLTTRHVMLDGAPIVRAYHDEDDHGWQFHSEHVTRTEDAMVVALQEIVEMDPSVAEIADLPPGWMAWRKAPGTPWFRKLNHDDATRIVLDWSRVSSKDDFYDQVFLQCGAPSWHGRNLDALNDSFVRGGINQLGPPYVFGFLSLDATPSELISFRNSVLQIARKSVAENGGRYVEGKEP